MTRKLKNQIHSFLALAAASLLVAACQSDDFEGLAGGRCPIAFDTQVGWEQDQSRADIQTAANLNKFKVTCVKRNASKGDSYYFKDITATRSGSSYTTATEYYWLATGQETYDFYAYAPVGAVTVTNPVTPGAPTLYYDASTTNCDLTAAVVTGKSDRPTTSAAAVVNLTFDHLLTGIRFTVADGCDNIAIKSIKITGINFSGKCTYASGQWQWSDLATNASKSIVRTFSPAFDPSGSGNNIDALDATNNPTEASFFVIPQTIPDGAKFELIYNDGTADKTVTADLSGTWTQGRIVTYAINVGSSGSEPTIGEINGHTWVDLGLPSGTKWAACNLGADSPTAYGDYYAWGETQPKTGFSSSTSATYDKTIDQLRAAGIIDGNNNLTSAYDAATANWGTDWRMPTDTEFQELIDNCTWTWKTSGNSDYNGKAGYEVRGSNGNTIFLPAAYYYQGNTLKKTYDHGRYWSSTDKSESSLYSYYLYLDNEEYASDGYLTRFYGLTIRPITKSSATDPGTPTPGATTSGSLNGHTWVDLGIRKSDIDNSITAGSANDRRIVFATCNIGATAPEDCGYYFRWGEQQGWKVNYTGTTINSATQYDNNGNPTSLAWTSNTFHYKNTGSWTLHNQSSSVVDFQGQTNLTCNGQTYGDAATYKWGSDWKMMNQSLGNKLNGINSLPATINVGTATLTLTWTNKNGKDGIEMKNTSTGESIFYPAAGYCLQNNIFADGYGYGRFWTSSRTEDSNIQHYVITFTNSGFNLKSFKSYFGYPIRPIAELPL